MIPEFFWSKLGDAVWWASMALLINVVGGLTFKFIGAVYKKQREEKYEK